MMGLSISIGTLADLGNNDPEGKSWLEEGLGAANRVLASAGYPAYTESRVAPPAGRAALDGFPYSFLHYLRRANAHHLADPQWQATPLPEGTDPTADEVLEEEYDMFRSHLICHSDSEGYYVPVDFEDVLFDEEGGDLPGGMLGSSQRLLAELIAVAPALGITLAGGELSDAEAALINARTADDGLSRELTVWIALYEAARLSVRHQTAIVFS
jgi:hypothetical protein